MILGLTTSQFIATALFALVCHGFIIAVAIQQKAIGGYIAFWALLGFTSLCMYLMFH